MLLRRMILFAKIRHNVNKKFGFSTFGKAEDETTFGKIKSWQIHSYGGLEELQLTNSRSPVLESPDDVIVKVSASSVNPIDVAMMNGYGSVFLNNMRKVNSCSKESVLEFPLTLGRDFSGVIIRKAHGVGNDYSIGDEVWGVVPVSSQGCHAEEVLVSKKYIQKKPKNISMVEAGSMLYAAVTAWSALKITGGLGLIPATGKNIMVLGGSGGVGTMAVQMLSSWGANVFTTCNSDAVPLLESLGVLEIIDYTEPNFFEKIQKFKYDIVLDCAGIGQDNASQYIQCLKDLPLSTYITLKSPMLRNVDDHGLFIGMMRNAASLIFNNFSINLFPKLSTVRWGFFIPLNSALIEITEEVSKSKIIPCIQKTYSFSEVPKAYEHVKAGHLRGKIVINLEER